MEDEEIQKQRNWIATIISIGFIILVGLFVWRMVYFLEMIQNGGVDLSKVSFSDRTSTSFKLENQPAEGNLKNIYSAKAPFLGNSLANITIIEFADFECPYSKEASFTLRELARKYPDKIHYVYRNFPISEIHPIAVRASEAGMCAQDQGMFWEYHDKLYQNQSQLDEDTLFEFAKEVNLNMGIFTGCMDSGRHVSTVQKDYDDGFMAGVRATPTFFINGNMIPGSIPGVVLEKIINSFENEEQGL